MRHIRLVVSLALIAAGCALIVASYAPRPVTAMWVVGGSHAAIVPFLSRGEMATDRNAS